MSTPIVPPRLPAGLVACRPGLRLRADAGGASDVPTRVLRVEPGEGARLVFRDTPVVIRFSRPIAPASLSAATVRLLAAGDAAVACERTLSPDGRIALLAPRRLLACGLEHVVVVSGLRDELGRPVVDHDSRFVPCDLVWEDLSG